MRACLLLLTYTGRWPPRMHISHAEPSRCNTSLAAFYLSRRDRARRVAHAAQSLRWAMVAHLMMVLLLLLLLPPPFAAAFTTTARLLDF